jgi:hypothetical protein
LRVSLITIKRTEDVTFETIKEEAFDERSNARFFVIGDSIVVTEWDEPGQKEEDIHMYWWLLTCNPYKRVTRKAMFSYCVDNERLALPGFKDELAMVRECVFATHFSVPQTN